MKIENNPLYENALLQSHRIILASQSPRRQELLKGLDIEFETIVIPNLEESYPEELKGEDIPKYLAKQKAEAYESYLQGLTLVITADTIVWMNGRVYGKPHTEAEARQMLSDLSGGTHQVITGVCITTEHTQDCFATTSNVTFAHLTDREISYYVERYMPMDKAGSYGVQEWIGYIGVEHIEGSYYNVMGLPIQQLYQRLKRIEK